MPVFSGIGSRMKFYESMRGNGEYLMPLIPVAIRLDGRAFHTYTRGLDKPFDYALISIMTDLTWYLVEETNAKVGYTQSDEITLVLQQRDWKQQHYFDGRVDKINSVLASSCSVMFNKLVTRSPRLDAAMRANHQSAPVFDCRCFNLPTETEAINLLVWREQDAVRNSIQSAGQANFSHSTLFNKTCDQIQEMLFQQKGINWNDYPSSCKRGTYVRRKTVERPLTDVERNALPERHEARKNPDAAVTVQITETLDLPILTTITNAADVVFRGADPITA